MEYQPLLTNLLLKLEILASVVGMLLIYKHKSTYWIYFVFYLTFISFADYFSLEITNFFNIKKQLYYAYIVIPIQFIFFYWLYALKSLKNKQLFWVCIILYLLSFIPVELYFSKLKVVYSFNYTIGTLILMYLVILEFKKQIVTDDILQFPRNKMFYINFGVILFYVGNLPFFGLYNLLIKELSIWNIYYIYYLISNCIMYLLFSASFIWGKVK